MVGCVFFAQTAWAADARKVALELRAQFADDLRQLAEWCKANGMEAEAQKTLRVLPPRDPFKLYIPVLSAEIGPAKLPDDASEKLKEWDSRLTQLRRAHAATLFDMARRAVRTGREGLALDLAIAAIQADPDYEPARRLFGYQKYRDQWRTPYEVKKLRSGQVWSDRFGWLPKAHLRRYEEGQRYYNGRWISAEEDAERHRDIRSGWKIETEHYVVHTNHSIEAAVALAEKLERLHRLWQRLFIRFYASEADVAALFEGNARALNAPVQHDVMYFRDRDDYVRSLQAIVPGIDISIGVYLDGPRCAYFFASDGGDDRTLYHEGTHQLFHESRPVAPNVGGCCNFWIVEGIAMFMESLRQEDGYYVLGGFDDARLHAAQYRLLVDKFYIPLSEFSGYGMEKIQKDPRIATLYSQAAGLTHFLIFDDGGRYRDALVAYLVAVYNGSADAQTLSKLTGMRYGELDQQYRAFIESGDENKSE